MSRFLIAALLALACLPLGAQEVSQSPALTIDRVAAIAGTEPILVSEVEVKIQQAARDLQDAGQPLPSEPADIAKFRRQVLDQMINEALLVQRAKEAKVDIPEADISTRVDRYITSVRQKYPDEAAFRAELRSAGIGTPDQWRAQTIEVERRKAMQQSLIDKLKVDGKLSPVPVSDEEVAAYFEEQKAGLQPIPATVSYLQIVVAPQPNETERAATRAKAESLLVELRGGADFASVAKRESMDGSAAQGGDLGWLRRGDVVPEFERMMISMPPGRVSPVFESKFGYHILKVEKAQTGEFKVRHILLRPPIDSADVERAHRQADSIAAAWRGGADADSLTASIGDRWAQKEIIVDVYRDSLDAQHRQAFEGKAEGAVTDAFPIVDPGRDTPRFAVAQLTDVTEAHVPRLDEVRERVRAQLSQERAIERLLKDLRESSYVKILVDERGDIQN
jgi:peptidyl-prolyl cis-trans isomerase SurA